jgi:hypothetical protein
VSARVARTVLPVFVQMYGCIDVCSLAGKLCLGSVQLRLRWAAKRVPAAALALFSGRLDRYSDIRIMSGRSTPFIAYVGAHMTCSRTCH